MHDHVHVNVHVHAEGRMPRCTPLAHGRFASTRDSAPLRSPTRSTDEIWPLVSLPTAVPGILDRVVPLQTALNGYAVPSAVRFAITTTLFNQHGTRYLVRHYCYVTCSLRAYVAFVSVIRPVLAIPGSSHERTFSNEDRLI